MNEPITSETDFCRERLAQYCIGNTLDIGYGGHKPIVPNAICLDRAKECLDYPLHWFGDAIDLPFKDETVDSLFSSHCAEDFEDTAAALREWVRVLKKGGRLILFLPDQKRYEAHCKSIGIIPNGAHKHADFSLQFVKNRLPCNARVIYEQDAPTPNNPYSFELCCVKTL